MSLSVGLIAAQRRGQTGRGYVEKGAERRGKVGLDVVEEDVDVLCVLGGVERKEDVSRHNATAVQGAVKVEQNGGEAA